MAAIDHLPGSWLTGSCITDASTNNQIYTLASARQTVVTLTDANKQVRYFTAPSYYIYIKNVQAANPGDINEATIVLIDGWIYNLAVGMYQNNANLANLQNLTPLQLMYYAGSTVPPTAAPVAVLLLLLELTNVSPALNMSVIVTFRAVLGPRLTSVTV